MHAHPQRIPFYIVLLAHVRHPFAKPAETGRRRRDAGRLDGNRRHASSTCVRSEAPPRGDASNFDRVRAGIFTHFRRSRTGSARRGKFLLRKTASRVTTLKIDTYWLK